MNKYFSITDTIYDITEKYPETIDFLVTHGFDNLKNNIMRKTIGKTISLETALKSKNLNTEIFELKLVDLLEGKEIFKEKKHLDNAITISGILPCPTRLQYLESVEHFLESNYLDVNLNLQAASMGLDFLKNDFHNNKLSDVYLSAGFSLFFENQFMNEENKSLFNTPLDINFNSDFQNDRLDLQDPKNNYHIINIVPAIFVVNLSLLGDRKMPKSWADLLTPEFENTIALPTNDLDLFNSIILYIYKEYGEDGVKSLGRGLVSNMHPSEMVKAKKTEQMPIINIMPYFFASMVENNKNLEPVWPEDGAIISPIFLMVKYSSRDQSKQLVDFIISKESSEILSANGKFPSTHIDINNDLSNKKLNWIGWDYIYNNDIGKLMIETEDIFFSAKL